MLLSLRGYPWPVDTVLTYILGIVIVAVGVLLSIIPVPLCWLTVSCGLLVQLRVCENGLPRASDVRSVVS